MIAKEPRVEVWDATSDAGWLPCAEVQSQSQGVVDECSHVSR